MDRDPRSITRGFFDVIGTSMHVRWSGRGVPLLLIHQSPVSARVLEERLHAFGEQYLCIAPDIPGMGQSDTIAEPVPTIELLAKYFLALLDRLGIERALLYGAHTGALICTHMALSQKHRVAGLVLDGYPVYTDEEAAQRLSNYFPPLTLSWDGAHLLFLWHRYREQFLYWPWNAKAARTRASRGVPDPAHLQAGVAEMARTHDTYPQCYAAAFSYDATSALRGLDAETHFLASDADSLTRKLSLWQPKAGLHHVHKISGGHGAQMIEERRVLDDIASRNPDLAPMTGLPAHAASPVRAYARSPDGHLVATRRLPGRAEPVLVLPPIPACADFVLAMPGINTVGRELILIDPPAIGGVPPGSARRIQGCIAAIAEALKTTERLDILAFGYSAALIPALRAALGDRLHKVIAVDAPMDMQPPEIFDSTLCPSGSHLLRYWDRWRFEKLFSPATARSSDAIRHGASEDLATLGRFTLAALDALPVWQEIETELRPNLGGKWVSTLTDADSMVFSEIDSATSHGLQALQPRASTVDLSRTGQSLFGWLRDM
jgi:pimeloyl-ACP methyl ester carboxylesterase